MPELYSSSPNPWLANTGGWYGKPRVRVDWANLVSNYSYGGCVVVARPS